MHVVVCCLDKVIVCEVVVHRSTQETTRVFVVHKSDWKIEHEFVVHN
jgi:hypothetical protein